MKRNKNAKTTSSKCGKFCMACGWFATMLLTTWGSRFLQYFKSIILSRVVTKESKKLHVRPVWSVFVLSWRLWTQSFIKRTAETSDWVGFMYRIFFVFTVCACHCIALWWCISFSDRQSICNPHRSLQTCTERGAYCGATKPHKTNNGTI